MGVLRSMLNLPAGRRTKWLVLVFWLVLVAAILGWLLGLVTNATLHRRTRAPRPGSRRGS